MRALAFSVVALLSMAGFAKLQAAEPPFRPALVGNGAKALVNLIDTTKLVEKGQGNGALSFQCYVTTSGWSVDAATYRGTPESKALDKEVMSALKRCRFIPAVYNGKPTGVLFLGTVLFFVKDGKPRLRVYASQNRDDIEKGNDFIAPQLVEEVGDWERVKNELEKARVYLQKGVVELAITVDANGNQKNIKLVSEDPVGFNFGHATLTLYSGSKYIPGFRNGHPVDCTFDYHVWFWTLYRGPKG